MKTHDSDISPTPSSPSLPHDGLFQVALELGQHRHMLGQILDGQAAMARGQDHLIQTFQAHCEGTSTSRTSSRLSTSTATATSTDILIRKGASKAMGELLAWAAGKIGGWLLTNIVPTIIAALSMIGTYFLGFGQTLLKMLGALLRAFGLG